MIELERIRCEGEVSMLKLTCHVVMMVITHLLWLPMAEETSAQGIISDFQVIS